MKLFKNKYNRKFFIDKVSLPLFHYPVLTFYRLAFPSKYNFKDNSIISLVENKIYSSLLIYGT